MIDLVRRVFPGGDCRGIRKSLAFWPDPRTAVADRHPRAFGVAVIPWVQAGLLDTEKVFADRFG